MKQMNNYYRLINPIKKLDYLPLLFIRLILAYGFYEPATLKWKNIQGTGEWFQGMGYPLPFLSAYLAATTEMLGVVLLILGLGTRIISIPLLFVMIVAIATVHWGNGFEAGNNGIEIPLYYMIMLLVLLINGAGKLSVDSLMGRK